MMTHMVSPARTVEKAPAHVLRERIISSVILSDRVNAVSNLFHSTRCVELDNVPIADAKARPARIARPPQMRTA